MVRNLTTIMTALALVACGGDDDGATPDAGSGGVDSGSMMGVDSGTGGTDSGSADPCAASQEDALDTLGCNGGFISGDSAPNTLWGECTVGGEANPPGTCTGTGLVCDGGEVGEAGLCLALCTPGPTYVSTGGCPAGHRCFEGGLCFRDCDTTHPCGEGFECDSEGSCLPADEEPDPKG